VCGVGFGFDSQEVVINKHTKYYLLAGKVWMPLKNSDKQTHKVLPFGRKSVDAVEKQR
jgi:hypothetical protein